MEGGGRRNNHVPPGPSSALHHSADGGAMGLGEAVNHTMDNMGGGSGGGGGARSHGNSLTLRGCLGSVPGLQ